MAYSKPAQIAEVSVEYGVKKAHYPLLTVLILGFLGGAFIALGFLLDIRVISSAPAEWGSIANFIGAAVFPIGLILVLLAGGELLTGNMMAVPLARMAGRISTGDVCKNLVLITLSNFVGALFVAYFFGHVVGLTASGDLILRSWSIWPVISWTTASCKRLCPGSAATGWLLWRFGCLMVQTI